MFPNRFKADEKWATIIPSRTPRFKVHGTLGHAKNAIRSAISKGALYRREGDEWVIYLDTTGIPYKSLDKILKGIKNV